MEEKEWKKRLLEDFSRLADEEEERLERWAKEHQEEDARLVPKKRE